MTAYRNPTDTITVTETGVRVKALPLPDYSHVICPSCGSGSDSTVVVWEIPAEYYANTEPDFIRCEACGDVTEVNPDGWDTHQRIIFESELPDEDPRADFDWGDIVSVAHSDPDYDDHVVVSTPRAYAFEWEVQGDKTVADFNPDHAPVDAVVITIPEGILRDEYPLYCGCEPLQLSDIPDDHYYSYPESRLEKIDTVDPPTRHISNIRPSPYHLESFTVEENVEFIEEIAQTGLDYPPLARKVGSEFELINGHKRTWVLSVVGREMIPLNIQEYSDKRAADIWAKNHFDEYNREKQQQALRRLVSVLGDGVCDLSHISVREIDASDLADNIRTQIPELKRGENVYTTEEVAVPVSVEDESV